MEPQYEVKFLVEGYSTPSLHVFEAHEIVDENGFINNDVVFEKVKQHYMHATQLVSIKPL